MASRFYALVAGVGPGTRSAVAQKFAKAYPIVVLARRAESYTELVSEIKERGGFALGIFTDVSSTDSIKEVFHTIEGEFSKDSPCVAAVFNFGGKLSQKPFLELTEAEFSTPYHVNCKGGFLFSQAVLPKLLKATTQSPEHSPTLLFTGATASLKGSAQMASFAVGKFATRDLAQSLARGFGPQENLKEAGSGAKISPESIADTYWYLHTQPGSAFSHELEVRPYVEKW